MANEHRRHVGEALLANAGWLRGLARDLARDGDHADDLVQSVWLAALEKPPRHGGDERSLRAWLGRVLRRRWSNQWRGEARRERREHDAARPEHIPPAGDTSERLELQQRVIAALMHLPESDRELVVLRYFDELPPREIARRLGSTSSAVRTRLSRSLDKLKTRLDAEYGGDRRVWAVELVVLALQSGPATLSLPLRLAIGGVLITSLAIMAWVVAAQPNETEGARASAAQLSAPTEFAVELDADGKSTSHDAREPVAAPEPATADNRPTAENPRARLIVIGRVIDEHGEPIEGASIVAPTVAGGVRSPVDVDGRFEFALEFDSVRRANPRTPLELRAEAPARAWQTRFLNITEAGEVQLGEIVLRAGGSIVGRAVGRNGEPVADALVYARRAVADDDPRALARLAAFGFGGFLEGIEHSVSTGVDGRFRLDGVPATVQAVFIGKPRHLWGVLRRCEVPVAGVLDVGHIEVAHEEALDTIRGVVLASDGTPVLGSHVNLTNVDDVEGNSLFTSTTTDAEGTFELRAAREHSFRIHARAPRGGLGRATVAPIVAGARNVRLQFARTKFIDVVVSDLAGAPLEPVLFVGLTPNQRGIGLRSERVEAGRYRIEPCEQTFSLAVSSPGYRFTTRGPFEPGSTPEHIAFALERVGSFKGRVSAQGVGIANASVHAHRALASNDDASQHSLADGFGTRCEPRADGPIVVTDEHGRFSLPVSSDGSWFVHAEAPAFARAEIGPIEHIFGRERAELELSLQPGGAIEGRLLVADGVDPAGTVVGVSGGDGHVALTTLASDGMYRFDGLQPGPHQILRCDAKEIERMGSAAHASVENEDPHPWNVEVLSGSTVRFDLDARNEVPCRIEGRLVIDGRPASEWTASALGPRSHEDRCTLDPNGDFVLRMAEPGHVRIWLTSSPVGRSYRVVTRDLSLTAPNTSWSVEFNTGSIELTGLGDLSSQDGSNPRTEGNLPSYRLEVKLVDGSLWAVEAIHAPNGAATVHQVPEGHVVLRRSDGGQATPSSRAVGQVDLLAGETRTITPR